MNAIYEKYKDTYVAYRENNPEKVAAAKKAWADAHKEAVRASKRRYYEANREKVIAKATAWQQENAERHGLFVAVWQEAHREQTAATTAAWGKVNRPRRASSRQLRRTRLAGLATEQVVVAVLYERDKGICGICGKRVAKVPRDKMMRASHDHILPVSEGGANTYANARLAHLRCNIARGARGSAQLRMV